MTDPAYQFEQFSHADPDDMTAPLVDVIDLWTSSSESSRYSYSRNSEMLAYLNLEVGPVAPQRVYLPERATREEMSRIRMRSGFGPELTEATVTRMRREINQHGENPAAVLPRIMSGNRVLAIGEAHFDDNPQRKITAESMASLKASGATHLAMEFPQRIQPYLDEFTRTGRIDPKVLPPLARDASEIAILMEARKAGLKIVAVDADGPYQELSRTRRREVEIDPIDGPKENVDRDFVMASKIDGILKENQANKVVFYGGKLHMDTTADRHETAVEILRKKYSVASVASQIYAQDNDVLAAMTPDIAATVMINTKECPTIARQKLSKYDTNYYSNWDYLILFPAARRGR